MKKVLPVSKTSQKVSSNLMDNVLTYRLDFPNKFLLLLIPLVGLIFIPSFFLSRVPKDISIYICLSLVLVTGGFLLSETRRKLIWALIIGSIAFLANLIPFEHSEPIFLLRMLSLSAFFIWLLYYVFKKIAKARRISQNIIFGAIDGYLLLGILGGFIFRLIHHFYPNSFAIANGMELRLDVFTYFSFVTLTNLGYGDISPIAPPSQALALFLAISGQLYLAIVIGILVGKFILFRPR